MNREQFLDSLKSDQGTFTDQQANATGKRWELAKKIREDLGKEGKIDVIGGVFGEWVGCDGMVEQIIRPEEGGVFVKIYGCSYLYKGYPEERKVHGLELAKSMISEIPRNIIGRSFVFSSAVVFMYVFFKKRLIKHLENLFDVIENRSLKWNDIREKDYNVPVREIKRAITVALKENHNIWTLLVAKVARFVCLFLELDSAYRFRIQDVIGELNLANAKKYPIDEFFRLLNLLLHRETEHGIAHKWRFLRVVLSGVLWTSPGLAAILSSFMRNLDRDKVKMDESDWYFCLRWKSYDFGGKDQAWRFAERDRIDKEKGHIFVL